MRHNNGDRKTILKAQAEIQATKNDGLYQCDSHRNIGGVTILCSGYVFTEISMGMTDGLRVRDERKESYR